MSAMCRSSVCLESAFKTGELCHVQQSLLSDTNSGECSYLQDMIGALEQLAGKVCDEGSWLGFGVRVPGPDECGWISL